MKRQLPRGAGPDGSILLMTLIIMGILCLAIGSYLYLLRTTSNWVERSQAWNTALALAEAGIEEGLAQINSGFGTNNLGSANGNGWSGPAGGIYGPKVVTMPGGGTYSATIDMSGALSSMPVITVTGTTNPPASSQPVSRTVRVFTATAFAFPGGMTAIEDITMNGNNVTLNSFDSSDPNYSTNGMYNPLAWKSNGDIASLEGFIKLGNGDIFGSMWLGATANGYSMKQNGSVSGTINNDFNAMFPDVTEPYTSGTTPGNMGTTNYWVLGSRQYYYSGDANPAGGTIDVKGNATLYVTGSFTMQQINGQIIIEQNASLKLYVGGPTTVLGQINVTPPGANATTFQYYGLPGNTSITMGGNGTFVGSIYAPEAALTLNGGGALPFDYSGAMVVQSLVSNGHFDLHYDENLKRIGPVTGFVVSKWQEL